MERGWKIYFFKCFNFAANQLVSKMEIITFESKAYKDLDNKITAIADYIFNHTEAESTNEDEIWVDSYEVCTFLKISEKTLQRLRVANYCLLQYSGALLLQNKRSKTDAGRTTDKEQ